MTSRQPQRGSLSVEFALLVPALVLLFSLVIGGARVWLARADMELVAGAAARAGSLERTPDQAQRAAQDVAHAQATSRSLRCAALQVRLDTGALLRSAGTRGSVTSTVTCEVPLSDVLVPGWPGTITVRASGTAVVDTYRGRR